MIAATSPSIQFDPAPPRPWQQALADATKQQQLRTLSKTLDQLSPQEKADLQKLGQRQTELARRLEKALSQMQQTAGELSPTDPLAAQTLADAVEQARDEALSGKMHQAAQQLAGNQLAQAANRRHIDYRTTLAAHLVAGLAGRDHVLAAALRAGQEIGHGRKVRSTKYEG